MSARPMMKANLFYMLVILAAFMAGCIWNDHGNIGLTLETISAENIPPVFNSAFKLKYPDCEVELVERLYIKGAEFRAHYHYHYIRPNGEKGSIGLLEHDSDVVFFDTVSGDLIEGIEE